VVSDKVLLLWVPSRVRGGKMDGQTFPVGLLYAGRVMEDMGINVTIYDIYQHAFDPENTDKFCWAKIKALITTLKPKIVGFGGIATSYGWTKILSLKIKEDFPDILQIAGGALASTYQLLLNKTAIEVVFHGEVERNLPVFINRLNNGGNIYDIPGISYLSEKREIVKNSPQKQIENLDDIPFPAYHLVNLKDYFYQEEPFYKSFLKSNYENLKSQALYEKTERKIGNVEVLFPVITARGCTHQCSFCYRHMARYRKHSVDYVVRHLKYIKKEFGISGIYFYDELFNGDIQWVSDFCDAIERTDLNLIYKASGRADKVSRKLLTRMSDTGCFNLEFGQESGSDKILREYRKGITRKQNLEATRLIRECGIYSVVQLVIGSPGETRETIKETIDFLKNVNSKIFSLNYLIPLPGAHIWKHVEGNNLISDVETYLDQVSQKNAEPIVNLTKSPEAEWKNWASYIIYKLDCHHAVIEGDLAGLIKAFGKYCLKRIVPDNARKTLKDMLKNLSRENRRESH